MVKFRYLGTFCGSFASMTYFSNQNSSKPFNFLNQSKLRKVKLFAEEKHQLEEKTRVLVVGAGLTGCLTAYLLNQKC